LLGKTYSDKGRISFPNKLLVKYIIVSVLCCSKCHFNSLFTFFSVFSLGNSLISLYLLVKIEKLEKITMAFKEFWILSKVSEKFNCSRICLEAFFLVFLILNFINNYIFYFPPNRSCFEWESPIRSFFALILWVCGCIWFDISTVPAAMLLFLLK
jgi:hypothetical protein